MNCLLLLYEHLQGYLMKQNRMEEQSCDQMHQTQVPLDRNQSSKTEHTSDDLRTGLFQYIQDTGKKILKLLKST